MVAAGHKGPSLGKIRRLVKDDLEPGQFVPEVGVELCHVGEVGPLTLGARAHHAHDEELKLDRLLAGEDPNGAVALGAAARRTLRERREQGAVEHVTPADDGRRALCALRIPRADVRNPILRYNQHRVIHMILCKEFHMPVVKPISDLQRNFGSIADSCHQTKEPVYLTKNGSASLVVMDAEAYDEQTRALSAIQEREDRIQRAITRGYDDLVNCRVRPWKQAKADADRIRAARHEIG